jgi:hypothetical protein
VFHSIFATQNKHKKVVLAWQGERGAMGNQFKLILDSRVDLDFSLDRIDNESQIDTN